MATRVARVRQHILEKGENAPAAQLEDDLEFLVRNCERANCLGLGPVELSPYVQALLHTNDPGAGAAQSGKDAAVASG